MSHPTFYGRAFFRGKIEDGVVIPFDGGSFGDVYQTAHPPPGVTRVDGLLVPGFIDTHIHGADGADFMDADEDGNRRIVKYHTQHGTTALAATTLSASRERLHDAVRAITRTRTTAVEGAEICAVHLEGPYINRTRAGAQDLASIRPADIAEIESLLGEMGGVLCIMTVAPEIEGTRELIEHFRRRVLFSIGHTAADYGEATAAVEWGARHFTHLFNAMTGMHHREPGVVGAALVATDTTAEIIADGVHVHPAMLRIAVMTMPGRITLITDAIRACGMPDGTYKLYAHDVRVDGGMARLSDGTLAGSVLTMDAAVRNLVELAGLPIESVLPLATEVPARVLGVASRKGRIDRAYDADLVVLNTKLGIDRVFARGLEVELA